MRKSGSEESDKWYSRFERKSVTASKQKRQRKKTSSDFSKKKNTFSRENFKSEMKYKMLSHSSLFAPEKIPSESQAILDNFDEIIQDVRPLNSKQMAHLTDDIRALSHELTDERDERRVGYMNEASRITAYVYYFVWWNLVRYTRLFAALPETAFDFLNTSYCLDIGSGPLTIPIALWLARPELRKKKLTWYCMDLSQNSLAVGEDLFLAVASKVLINDSDVNSSLWKIIRIKGAMGTPVRNKISFVTSANMFNEIAQNTIESSEDSLASQWIKTILSYTEKNAHIFIAEPGVPPSSRMLSLMRSKFLEKKMNVIYPCPHEGFCPMDGKNAKHGGKWCHFAFKVETTDAEIPKKLKALSIKAGLPKDRTVLSFLMITADLKTNVKKSKDILRIRIASDPILLPDYKIGFYACSEIGLLLVVTSNPESLNSGDLICINQPQDQVSLIRDKKSGAKRIVLL